MSRPLRVASRVRACNQGSRLVRRQADTVGARVDIEADARSGTALGSAGLAAQMARRFDPRRMTRSGRLGREAPRHRMPRRSRPPSPPGLPRPPGGRGGFLRPLIPEIERLPGRATLPRISAAGRRVRDRRRGGTARPAAARRRRRRDQARIVARPRRSHREDRTGLHTELLDLAMREVRGRVKPHTWQAFHLLAIERRSGEEVGPVASRSTPGSPTWHGATSNG